MTDEETAALAAEIERVVNAMRSARRDVIVACATDALLALGLSKRDVLGEVFDYLESLR